MAELAISRFFETPLIRQRFEGDFAGLAAAVLAQLPAQGSDWAPVDPAGLGEAGAVLLQHLVGLAERFSLDAHGRPPRHVWALDLTGRHVAAGDTILPDWDAGAYWRAIIRLSGSALLAIEDPRVPMRQMHEPGVRLRAPDGIPEEGERSDVALAPGEVVLMPGWLRCSMRNGGTDPVVELGLSLFARHAPSAT